MDIATRIAGFEESLAFTSRSERLDPRSATRLHRGIYLPVEISASLRPEDRHLARVLAVQERAVGGPVFSHVSAAVLLGLPLHSGADGPVHLTTRVAGPNRRSPGIVRHRAPLAEHEVVEVCGLLCTSPDRTLLDLARFEPAETAISCADAFLRREFRVDRRIDHLRLECWRGGMLETLARMPGERGVLRAQEVLELADPRTDSVLESVSHLYLRRLGFDVELQVPVPSPTGGTYFVDFEFLGLGLFGECDGKAKYLDERLRGGNSADELVYREKRRENWITGTTRNDIIRWGWPETATIHRFARHLSACRVRIPRRPGPPRPR